MPEHVKAKVIERLAEPFFEEPVVVQDREGNDVTIPPDRYLMGMNARVLVAADKEQYERDNPEAAGKAKGGVNIDNQVVVGVSWQQVRDEVMDGIDDDEVERRIEQAPAADHDGVQVALASRCAVQGAEADP